MSYIVNGDAAPSWGEDTAPFPIYERDEYDPDEQRERWKQLLTHMIYGLTDPAEPTRLIRNDIFDDMLAEQERELRDVRVRAAYFPRDVAGLYARTDHVLEVLEELRRTLLEALSDAQALTAYGFQRGLEARSRQGADVAYSEPVPAALIHALNGPRTAEPVPVVLTLRGHTVVAYVTPGRGCDPAEIWESIQRAVPRQAVA